MMGLARRLKGAVRCLAVGLFGLLELVGLPRTPGQHVDKETRGR